MEIGSITVSYELDEPGDMITGVSIEGDLATATLLGLLRMAEDTILHMDETDD